MNKKTYGFEEAKAIILRERHRRIFAVPVHGLGTITFTKMDEENDLPLTYIATIPADPFMDKWHVMDHTSYLHEIFGAFKYGKGSHSLIHTDVKGYTRKFTYGNEELIPFNLLMQRRWELEGDNPVY